MFKITQKPQAEKEVFTKYYFKLVQIEFHNVNSVQQAKQYYAEKYNQICQPVLEWEQHQKQQVKATIKPLYAQPKQEQIIKIKHDNKMTLIFVQDTFRITNKQEIEVFEDYRKTIE